MRQMDNRGRFAPDMRRIHDRDRFAPRDRPDPHWSEVLRALREVAGVTQEGWAARLGYGRRTIQRWEHAELAPDERATNAIVQLCASLGLFREYQTSVLAGRTLTPDRLAALLGDARVAVLDAPSQPREITALPPARLVLPAPLTSLVGREQEIAEVRQLLGTTRLLTLTGTGGVGKTRLALEAVHDLPPGLTDAVWLVELASLSDARLVAQSVATPLGVREQPDRTLLTTLADALRDRRLLILLDNCEHVAEGCFELIAALLPKCPELRFVVTSRTVLGVSGEHSWAVPPLPLPESPQVSREDIARSDAVQLLVQRARAVVPSFALTNETCEPIAEVCARLDGVPLAIELAAAWLRVLSPTELARRLADPFDLLVSTAQDVPTRQRTLRATLDWSYRLLDEPEQDLLARLSVFAGGATLEAIEAIASEDERGGSTILRSLARLVDASLVQRLDTPAIEPRFRLLETVRQYAREQLEARGALTPVSHRHATTFLRLAEKAYTQLHGPELVTWLDRLQRDHDNLRAALHWALAQQDAELSGRLAASLGLFWYRRWHIREGRALLEAALALPSGPDQAAARVQMLHASGLLALAHGDCPAAHGYAEQGVELARQLSDQRRLAEGLGLLGFVTRVQGDWDLARRALEECLELARAVGDQFGVAMSLHHLGLLALDAEGDAVRAWSLSEASLSLARDIGDHRLEANVLGAMGRVARARGDAATAHHLLLVALTAYRDIGDLGTLSHVLYTWAALAADAGEHERAVRLAAAAARVTELVGSQLGSVILREYEKWLPSARRSLGDREFARAWAEGQAPTLEQTIDLALAEAAKPERLDTGSEAAPAPQPLPISDWQIGADDLSRSAT